MGCIFKSTRMDKSLPSAAKNWNDLPENEQKWKRRVIATLVAIATIIAIGTALGLYFSLTSSYPGVAAVPAVIGGIAMGIFGIAILCTYIFWGFTCNGKSADELRLDLYGRTSLPGAYNGYNKGIAPLVKRGVLDIQQARELQTIFREYDLIRKQEKIYDNLSRTDQSNYTANPQFFPEIKAAKEKRTELDHRWRVLRNNLFPTSS